MNKDPLIARLRSGAPQLSIRRDTHNRRRLASSAQQRLWFLSHLQVNAATYAVPLAFHVRGPLCTDWLSEALTTIVARHESLRTALFEREGTLWQEPAPPMRIAVPLRQASGLAEANAMARAEVQIPFDLASPPLLRALCIGAGDQDTLVVFVFHHVAVDAWSLGLFFSELGALWDARSQGEPLLPVLDVQYSDYADWQREWLRGPNAVAQRDFWCQHLSGSLPQLQFGQGNAIDRDHLDAGAVEHFRWQGDLVIALQALAEKERTTTFVVLLAGFQTLLHRYSLQDSIVLGVPVACRTQPETEKLIGFFTNTLALRADFIGDPCFSTVVRRSKETVLGALDAQELPFDQVVNALSLPRESMRNPLFRAMFVMQNTPSEVALRLSGISVDEVPVHSGTAKFDLTLSVKVGPRSLEGEVEFSTQCFDRDWVTQLIRSFGNLLADAVLRPQVAVAELSLLAPAEAERLVSSTNSNVVAYPAAETIIGLYEAQVRLVPDAVAIEFGGSTVTYSDLDARANRLARVLHEQGAGPESVIGVCMDRSIDLVVALLGALKSGAAFAPLDPEFPVERIRQVCEDAAPLLVLTQQHRRPKLSSLDLRVIEVDKIPHEGPASSLGLQVAPSQLAYVYYTSGSTGTPKGVLIEHRCAMNRLQWLRRRYPLSVRDGVLHKSPLIFDVAIWEIFLPLFSGATVVLAEAGAEADPKRLSSLLQTNSIVLAHFVPSLLGTYLDHTLSTDYPALRWAALSGEAVPADLPDRFAAHCNTELHNQYGQTETSEVAVWEGGHRTRNGSVPLGHQVGVYRLYVLDAGLGLVPPGVPGELCVAGIDGLARGYHRRPALTAEKFVPNPYSLEPGERLYRTGDLARFTANGMFEYLGRIDHQIKIHGCRVETGEVESVLTKHCSVSTCVVMLRPNEMGAHQLVAYVVSDDPDANVLAAHADRWLPVFMRPAVYVFVDHLPRTASGKIDRDRLPAPIAADFAARGGAEEVQTPLEAELAIMWAKLLGLRRVGRSDNFFAIGGNSLNAVDVVSKIASAFDVTISLQEFFAAPTVVGLADAIQQCLESHVASLPDEEVASLLGKANE
ncbi:non-ribosomal peptide synthetase [Bradyrhizobium sp.]